LVREKGRIVGIQADQGGKPLYVKAGKAVILAAGGFSNNRDLLQKYVPRAYEGCVSTWTPVDDGVAFRMGLGAGADISGMGSFSAFDGGLPYFEKGQGFWNHFLYTGDTQIIRQNWFQVNSFAERFAYVGPGQKIYKTQYKMAQPGHRVYPIFDSNFETSYQTHLESG